MSTECLAARSRDRGPFGKWLLALWAFAAVLRFWGLERFNSLVFDEVYFVQYAVDYLRQVPFFDGHPPLSKYAIALGIAVGRLLPFGRDTVNEMTGLVLSPWSYRWLNALVGSLLPVGLAWVGRLVTGRWVVGLVAGALLALDGLFLVESRYGLNNVYLVGFGLLGHGCWLKALASYRDRGTGGRDRWGWWLAAGLCFGATISVKWNGLGFLLGPWLLWAIAWGWRWLRGRYGAIEERTGERIGDGTTPLNYLDRVSPLTMALALAVIPALAYGVIWIPHLHWATDRGFWEINRQILTYHSNVGDGSAVHPYCSRWYTWPLLLRPIAYFYARTANPDAPINYADLTPTLPAGIEPTVYDVHALGNPLLWWASTAAVVALLVSVVRDGLRHWRDREQRLSASLAISVYFLANYSLNWLPWARISRCTFLYHYMGALAFAILTLAWFLTGGPRATLGPWRRSLAWGGGLAIAIAFGFWLPVYLGLPLSPAEWGARIWRLKPFLNWI